VTGRTRWKVRAALTVLVALATVIAYLVRHRPASEPPFAGIASAQSDEAWTGLFQRYGNTSGAWTGGDGAQALRLPDGGTMWFFADSYLGQAANGTRSAATTGDAHNTAVLYHDGALGPTFTAAPGIFGYTNGSDYTWASPPPPYPASQYELLNGDQVLDDGTVYKFYQLADRGIHPDGFEYKLVGTVVEAFTLAPGSDLLSPAGGTPVGVEDSAGSDPVIWGAATLTAGGYIYIYGVKPYHGGSSRYPLYLARVRVGGLAAGAAWQYYDGAPGCPGSANGWVADPQSASPLRNAVSAGFSVTDVNGTYVLLTNDTSSAGTSSNAVAYYAKCPTGFAPSSPRYLVYQSSLPSGYLAYEYRIVPQFSSGSHVLVCYSENTIAPGSNFTDASIYRPRFLDVELPGIGGAAGVITDPS
jgi:hypothetical protein